MKKILNVFVASAVAMSFAACNKDQVGHVPQSGDATTVQFSVVEAQTRAITDGQNDADGLTDESQVVSGVFLTPSGELTVSGFTGGPVYTSAKTLYNGITGTGISSAFLVNKPSTVTLNARSQDQTVDIEHLATLAAKGKFTLTSMFKNVDIKAGITEPTDGNNLFKYDLERVVSKVQVSQGATIAVGGTLENKATFEGYRYAVAGGAKKVFLYPTTAGTRQLSGAEVPVYTDFVSAIDGTITTFNNGAIQTPREVTKVSDNKLVAPLMEDAQFGTLNSLPLLMADDNNYQTTSVTNGIFFFENSFGKDNYATINGKGILNFADITYVKVYAKMIPAANQVIETATKDAANLVQYTYATQEEVEAERTDKMEVTKEYYDTNKGKPGFENLVEETGKYYMNITNKAGTFYKGANGKLYLSLSAARADGNTTSEKYDGGKMVWMVPANAQYAGTGNDKYVKYADTRRNNIYSLKVTNINGMGGNYDPIDPIDPNIPKPGTGDNPDEPKKDQDVKVDPKETYIKVEAKVLNWNLVHRGITLQ